MGVKSKKSGRRKQSMGLDHSNAFVRLTFDGLITFCLNRRAEPDSCEMGMVHVADHKRRLVVTRIKPNGVEELAYGPFDLNNDNEVSIDTENPTEPGVRIFKADSDNYLFNRIADSGDPEDFRWVLDLQGELLHGGALTLRRNSDEYRCRPRIFIRHGIFYTHSKTPQQYFRYPLTGQTGIVRLGKLADKVGADIVCDPIRGNVTVEVKNKQTFNLPADDGLKTRYRIDISNLCDPSVPNCPATSDFPHYYTVASDIDGIKFDLQYESLREAVGNTKSLSEFLHEKGFKGPLPPGFEKLGSNGPPQVCNVTFLSMTNTIP
jgi:hypothetical protein